MIRIMPVAGPQAWDEGLVVVLTTLRCRPHGSRHARGYPGAIAARLPANAERGDNNRQGSIPAIGQFEDTP